MVESVALPLLGAEPDGANVVLGLRHGRKGRVSDGAIEADASAHAAGRQEAVVGVAREAVDAVLALK